MDNWTIAQTKELFELVRQAGDNGRGLNWAFEKMSQKCSRSLNSVRNYYYSQLKMFQLLPSLASDLKIRLPKVKRDCRFGRFYDVEHLAEIHHVTAQSIVFRPYPFCFFQHISHTLTPFKSI